jgi:hypothetical protein
VFYMRGCGPLIYTATIDVSRIAPDCDKFRCLKIQTQILKAGARDTYWSGSYPYLLEPSEAGPRDPHRGDHRREAWNTATVPVLWSSSTCTCTLGRMMLGDAIEEMMKKNAGAPVQSSSMAVLEWQLVGHGGV